MNETLEMSGTMTEDLYEPFGTSESPMESTHREEPEWKPSELECLNGKVSPGESKSTHSTTTHNHHPKPMHANHVPQPDGVSPSYPLGSEQEQQPSNHLPQPIDRIPFMGLLLTVPLMSLFGETSLYIATCVFLVAVIRMVLTGFRINPVWGILNLSGFYFPVLWLAFGVLNWHRAKREFLFAVAAGACIFYLSQHNSILITPF